MIRFVPMAFVAILGGTACTSPTVLIVSVDGDLAPGRDLDELDLALYREGAQVLWSSYRLSGADRLPLRLRLEAPSRRESLVELRATANLAGSPVLSATRDASFVSGREIEVPLCLWRRCIGVEGEGCAAGLCMEGGDDAGPDGDAGPDSGEEVLCSDECLFAGDGLCDDGGRHSERQLCAHGTDCADCGPRLPAPCEPGCDGRQCGPDRCGGECGPGCEPDQSCEAGGACVRWIDVPAGTFLMGAPDEQIVRGGNEPQHEVTLTRSFQITALEVSQTWYAAVAGANPSRDPSCGTACPVEGLSWNQAAAFAATLSRLASVEPCYDCTTVDGEVSCELAPSLASIYDCDGYRLPTEAEWEHAARAGTSTPTYNGDLTWENAHCESPHEVLDPIAWFCGNAPSGEPQPRGLLQPNAFGLHDVLGNVNEYVHDWFAIYPLEPVVDPSQEEGERRVFRGGGAQTSAQLCRAGARSVAEPTERLALVGLRLARSSP